MWSWVVKAASWVGKTPAARQLAVWLAARLVKKGKDKIEAIKDKEKAKLEALAKAAGINPENLAAQAEAEANKPGDGK